MMNYPLHRYAKEKVMTESTELVLIAPETALEVYTADKGLDPYLAKIKAEVDGFIPDITTKKGRDAIASMAYKVSQSKTYLDKTGKELVDKLKEQPKLVDAERKRMRDYLDGLRDDVRKPLTEWEEAEERRVAEIQKRISEFEIIELSTDASHQDLQDIFVRLQGIVIDESFAEFSNSAAIAKERAINNLAALMVKRKAYEAEQAERDATAKREAEAKAAAERRELELQLAAEKAQREALEAQRAAEYERERAERQIEADRKERERQAEIAAAELKAREKDKAHKKEINNKAVTAFTNGGMTEECAKLAITLIAKKLIPAVIINY